MDFFSARVELVPFPVCYSQHPVRVPHPSRRPLRKGGRRGIIGAVKTPALSASLTAASQPPRRRRYFCAQAVDSPHYLYYFRATSMALLCLVRVHACCYRPNRDVSSSPEDQRGRSRLGGIYANDASVLCGYWLRGGPLDFQAASSSRPSQTVSFARSSVERFFRAWACAPLRLHFVSARPLLPCSSLK